MDFLNYSKDIFYIVLSFCVLWITIFLTWFIYYLIKSIKDFYSVVESVKKSVEQVEKIVYSTKEKFQHGLSYLSLFTFLKDFVIKNNKNKKTSTNKN
jgi:cell shape-determining protein MreC